MTRGEAGVHCTLSDWCLIVCAGMRRVLDFHRCAQPGTVFCHRHYRREPHFRCVESSKGKVDVCICSSYSWPILDSLPSTPAVVLSARSVFSPLVFVAIRRPHVSIFLSFDSSLLCFYFFPLPLALSPAVIDRATVRCLIHAKQPVLHTAKAEKARDRERKKKKKKKRRGKIERKELTQRTHVSVLDECMCVCVREACMSLPVMITYVEKCAVRRSARSSCRNPSF